MMSIRLVCICSMVTVITRGVHAFHFITFSSGMEFELPSNIQMCFIIFNIGFLHTSETSGLY